MIVSALFRVKFTSRRPRGIQGTSRAMTRGFNNGRRRRSTRPRPLYGSTQQLAGSPMKSPGKHRLAQATAVEGTDPSRPRQLEPLACWIVVRKSAQPTSGGLVHLQRLRYTTPLGPKWCITVQPLGRLVTQELGVHGGCITQDETARSSEHESKDSAPECGLTMDASC